jgi:hypothetical protein
MIRIPVTIEASIRLSSALVLAGLLVEAFSLIWSHPTAFIVFAVIGGGLMTLGILVYLLSLLIHHEAVAASHTRRSTDIKD